MTKPLFLLSNDDGVHAAGIRALAQAVEPFADWLIVAPHVERSGSGHAISLSTPLRLEQLASNIFAVEGTPADCVMFAMSKLVSRRPDFVISGINRGCNIGQDTLYSGTVAAAMEGCLHGIPAIAVSRQGRRAFALADYADAIKIVSLLFQNPALLAPARAAVLNVNIPDVPLSRMQGFAVAKLGRRIYDNQIAESVDPRGRPYYWVGGGGEDTQPIAGSDCTLLAAHYITLTALSPDHADFKVNEALHAGLAGALNQSMDNVR